MNLTIKWRLSFISMATLSGILLIFTWYIYFSLSHWVVSGQEKALLQEAKHIAMVYPNHIEQGSSQSNDANPNWLDQFVSSGQTSAIYNPNGVLIKTRRLSQWTPPLSIPHIDKLSGQSLRILSVRKRDYVRVILPSRSDSGAVLSWIVLVSSIESVESYMTKLLQILLIGSMIGILLAGVSGYYLGIFALRPISKVIRSVRSMDIYQLTERLVIPQHQDEITELSNTFNDLLDRLSTAIRKQNEFVANASHEFRTPLTVIDGYINLLARWGKEDLVITERAIVAIKKESDRLRRLTNSLLQLAGVHGTPVSQTDIDIVPVIKEVVEQLGEIYQREIIFQHVNEEIHSIIHPEYLHQIIAIVLQNAVKYTPSHKKIQINIPMISKQWQIEIIDEGSGISEESLPHIFDRFYRGDQERHRTTDGFGLGLSIAKELIESIGGEIEVKSKLSRGTAVTITLPPPIA